MYFFFLFKLGNLIQINSFKVPCVHHWKKRSDQRSVGFIWDSWRHSAVF